MVGLPRIEVEGKRFVLLEECEYERLCRDVGEGAETTDATEPARKLLLAIPWKALGLHLRPDGRKQALVASHRAVADANVVDRVGTFVLVALKTLRGKIPPAKFLR